MKSLLLAIVLLGSMSTLYASENCELHVYNPSDKVQNVLESKGYDVIDSTDRSEGTMYLRTYLVEELPTQDRNIIKLAYAETINSIGIGHTKGLSIQTAGQTSQTLFSIEDESLDSIRYEGEMADELLELVNKVPNCNEL